jgi:hypothetical protein
MCFKSRSVKLWGGISLIFTVAGACLLTYEINKHSIGVDRRSESRISPHIVRHHVCEDCGQGPGSCSPVSTAFLTKDIPGRPDGANAQGSLLLSVQELSHGASILRRRIHTSEIRKQCTSIRASSWPEAQSKSRGRTLRINLPAQTSASPGELSVFSEVLGWVGPEYREALLGALTQAPSSPKSSPQLFYKKGNLVDLWPWVSALSYFISFLDCGASVFSIWSRLH